MGLDTDIYIEVDEDDIKSVSGNVAKRFPTFFDHHPCFIYWEIPNIYKAESLVRYFAPGYERGQGELILGVIETLFRDEKVNRVWYTSDVNDFKDIQHHPVDETWIENFKTHLYTGEHTYRTSRAAGRVDEIPKDMYEVDMIITSYSPKGVKFISQTGTREEVIVNGN